MANPLIKLEFLRRFRSPMAAWGIPLVVLLPGLAVVGVYASSVALVGSSSSMSNGPFQGETQLINGNSVDFGPTLDPNALPGIGAGMFGAVAVTLFVTLLVLVPAFVGASIAGERHSQTLQPLQLTAMTPVQIVYGKLVSSLSYLMLALICTAPVLVIPFLLGGVSAKTVVGSFLLMVLVSFEFAAISLAVSSIMSKPAPAIIVSLLSVGFVTVAPFIVMGLGMASAANRPTFQAKTSALRYLAGFSPISLVSWIFDPKTQFDFEVITRMDKVGSLFWCLVISFAALAIACKKVKAPVERDR